jgi:hypothetical protein
MVDVRIEDASSKECVKFEPIQEFGEYVELSVIPCPGIDEISKGSLVLTVHCDGEDHRVRVQFLFISNDR